MSYTQSLWQEIYQNGTDLQVTDNGMVEAIYTIISMCIIIFIIYSFFFFLKRICNNC